jgi:hypothetical protein
MAYPTQTSMRQHAAQVVIGDGIGFDCSAKRSALILVKSTLRCLPLRNDFLVRRIPV